MDADKTDRPEPSKEEMAQMIEEFKKTIKTSTKIVSMESGTLCKVLVGRTPLDGEDKDGLQIQFSYEPAEKGEDRRQLLLLPKGNGK